MHITECHNPQQWNTFLTEHAPAQHSFLHSWEWGEMQRQYGRPVYRLLIQEEDRVLGSALCIIMPLPVGKTYVFSPRGPVFDVGVTDQTLLYQTITTSVEFCNIVRKHHSIFWRFEPIDKNDSWSEPPKEASFNARLRYCIEWNPLLWRRPLHPCLKKCLRVEDVEPSMSSVLDLSQSSEELLSHMKQKTRYNIRLSEKKGVRVEWHSKETGAQWDVLVDHFWKLVCETSNRHNKRSHPKSYYQKMFSVLGEQGILEVAVALHENDILVMNVFVYFGDTYTYLHGAATHYKKNLMAPHAAQWSAIQRAKQQGFRWYDFYGIGPQESTHTLYGVTLFKIGFGGETTQYPGTFEFSISSIWYTLYRMTKRLRTV